MIADVKWSAGPRMPRPVKGQAQGVIDGRIVYAGGFAFDRDGYQSPPVTAKREEVNAARWPRRIRYSRETWSFDPASARYEPCASRGSPRIWTAGRRASIAT
jgi:hypothetical protein